MADDPRGAMIEQESERRRRARDGILDAISDSDDPKMKVVLRLMLSVLEEIGDKIDVILKDERSLRQAVLNGHEKNHHAHHDWVQRKIAEEEQAEKEAAEISRAGKRAAVETAVRMLVTGLISLTAGFLGALAFMK